MKRLSRRVQFSHSIKAETIFTSWISIYYISWQSYTHSLPPSYKHFLYLWCYKETELHLYETHFKTSATFHVLEELCWFHGIIPSNSNGSLEILVSDQFCETIMKQNYWIQNFLISAESYITVKSVTVTLWHNYVKIMIDL